MYLNDRFQISHFYHLMLRSLSSHTCQIVTGEFTLRKLAGVISLSSMADRVNDNTKRVYLSVTLNMSYFILG